MENKMKESLGVMVGEILQRLKSLESKIVDNDVLIDMSNLEKITGHKKSWLYERVKDSTFPAPVRTGPNSVRWKMSVVRKWMSDLQSDQAREEASE